MYDRLINSNDSNDGNKSITSKIDPRKENSPKGPVTTEIKDLHVPNSKIQG